MTAVALGAGGLCAGPSNPHPETENTINTLVITVATYLDFMQSFILFSYNWFAYLTVLEPVLFPNYSAKEHYNEISPSNL